MGFPHAENNEAQSAKYVQDFLKDENSVYKYGTKPCYFNGMMMRHFLDCCLALNVHKIASASRAPDAKVPDSHKGEIVSALVEDHVSTVSRNQLQTALVDCNVFPNDTTLTSLISVGEYYYGQLQLKGLKPTRPEGNTISPVLQSIGASLDRFYGLDSRTSSTTAESASSEIDTTTSFGGAITAPVDVNEVFPKNIYDSDLDDNSFDWFGFN